jgi:arylsulfatase A-like enzyme
MGGCIDNYSHFFYWNGPNRHDLWLNGEEIWRDGEFFGDLMVTEAKRFIAEERDRPFFLYWAINFPHYPMQGTAKWREVYRHLDSPRRQYNAFVSTMDEMIGDVLGHLNSLGIEDNTLVIFQSDHGHSTEERAFFGGGNAGPYRGAKGGLFEGGIRVPSLVSWPGTLPEDVVRHQMAVGIDWFPTIAELTDSSLPEGVPLDGRSLLPVIQDENAASAHPHLYWQLGGGDKPQWAIRKGPWKLLGHPRDNSKRGTLDPQRDRLFLAHLEDDLGETTNLAHDHPEIVQRLQAMQREEAASIAASQ